MGRRTLGVHSGTASLKTKVVYVHTHADERKEKEAISVCAQVNNALQ